MRREWKGRAIVLNAMPYGDSDLIVSSMTEELGVVRGLAKGGRASRKRFAGCFEPFTLINLGCRLKDSGALAGIASADVVKARLGIRDSLDRINAGARMLELAGVVEVHGEEAGTAFALLDASLEMLEGATAPAALCGVFFVKYLNIAGYKIPHESCGQCGSEFGKAGAYYRGGHGILCGRCAGGQGARPVSLGCLAFIAGSETIDHRGMGRLRLSGAAASELFGLLGPYVASIAGKSLKTLDIAGR